MARSVEMSAVTFFFFNVLLFRVQGNGFTLRKTNPFGSEMSGPDHTFALTTVLYCFCQITATTLIYGLQLWAKTARLMFQCYAEACLHRSDCSHLTHWIFFCCF